MPYLRCLMLSILLVPFPVFAAEAQAWEVPQLMQRLAQVKKAESTFVERKTISYLRSPLVVSGALAYEAPHRLVKHVQNPIDERFIVDGERVSIERTVDGRRVTRTLGLNDHPLLRPLVAGLRATLAGDLAVLERIYTVWLTGDPASWQLRLLPRDEALRGVLEEVRIRGREDTLVAVEVHEANGDRSVMTISAR